MAFRRFRRLFRTRRRKIIALILVLLLAGGAFYLTRNDKKEETTSEKPKYYSQLTGNEVSKKDSEAPILGVMLENSEEARPQTGLDNAGIIFEAVTEGGITRYLAMFQENQPKDVGPVRSVRPHFVNWVTGFDASVAHVGGSTEALELVENLGTKSLNQFTYDEPYYRVNTREAPHNMYASTEKLRDLQKDKDHKKSTMSAIPRSNDSPSQTPQATSIQIDYSSPIFAVEFRYDQATNSYLRFLAGQPHIDAGNNKQISVKNVVVIKVVGTDSNSIQAIGSGEANIFKDGNVQTVTWKMSDTKDRIKLLDANGNEVPLNRGDTWFCVVTPNGSATF